MGYLARLQNASTRAQSILAQMQGMMPGGTNTLFANGQKVVGVYGNSRVLWLTIPGGGYRRKIECTLTITKPQLAIAPAFQTRLTRTDLNPEVTYIIDHVDPDDPLVWVLTLARFGK